MTTYVLDASAVLRFTDKEPGFNRVRDLLKLAAKSDAELLVSAVNWAEIVIALHKRGGGVSQIAVNLAANLAALPITIIPVDQVQAEVAASFKCNYKIPLADAFAATLSLLRSSGPPKQQATLVTADFDFKSIPAGTMKIEFLPTK